MKGDEGYGTDVLFCAKCGHVDDLVDNLCPECGGPVPTGQALDAMLEGNFLNCQHSTDELMAMAEIFSKSREADDRFIELQQEFFELMIKILRRIAESESVKGSDVRKFIEMAETENRILFSRRK